MPVNDFAGGYDYPAEVRFEIAEQDLPSYLRAADFLNITDVDAVCVQHEFGVFGGPAGNHLLALLRELEMPIVATLHTILPMSILAECMPSSFQGSCVSADALRITTGAPLVPRCVRASVRKKPCLGNADRRTKR